MNGLKQQNGLLDEFDELLWLATGESMTVHSENEVTVTFKDGSEIRVDVREG